MYELVREAILPLSFALFVLVVFHVYQRYQFYKAKNFFQKFPHDMINQIFNSDPELAGNYTILVAANLMDKTSGDQPVRAEKMAHILDMEETEFIHDFLPEIESEVQESILTKNSKGQYVIAKQLAAQIFVQLLTLKFKNKKKAKKYMLVFYKKFKKQIRKFIKRHHSQQKKKIRQY